MEFRSFLVLFSISQLLFGVIGSTSNEDKYLSIEDTVLHLKQKITQMEERLSSFGNASDLIHNISMAVREAEKRILEDKNQLLTRMEEMETKARDARNDLSAKLREVEESTSKREVEITKRVSEVEMRCVELTTDISTRLQNAEIRFLKMDTYLFVEVQKAQETSSEALERVHNAEQEVVSMLESKTDILQLKTDETRELLNSYVASHRDSENVIRKNISSSTEKLMHLNNSLSSKFESLTKKMRILENSLSGIEKDYANISFVSKMDESLKNLDKALKTDIQSIQSEFPPRVKQLEEKCALRDDVAQLNRTLRNHTSQIAGLNTDFLDIQNSCPDPPEIGNGYALLSNKRIQDTKNGAVITYACRGNRTLVGSGKIVCVSGEWTGDLPECINTSCYGEPPDLRNGKTIDFERKHGSKVRYECDGSYVLTSNSTVHCNQGNWEGQPPVCSFFDSTFYLETSTNPNFISCYSVDNYAKIDFKRVLYDGSEANFTGSVNKHLGLGYSYISLWGLHVRERYGFFQCGFSNERGSMKTVVHRLSVHGDIYFVDHSKVASIGDTVELEVKFDKGKSMRWRHNGVEVPSWNNRERVETSSVQLSDAGLFECYYEGERGQTPSAFLRLIVRKCKKDLFGEYCDQQCPPCYNGGVCHDSLGFCICPPGFNGTNCENVQCDGNRYGVDCSRDCWKKCEKYLFCLPDPYGCSCARGWKGFKCNEPCETGWYGADCKQRCHCAIGTTTCDRWTGFCAGGCAPGWTGQSCQIEVAD